MHRSDRIYLSKFALDLDPEYLDLDDFDLDCEIDSDGFYDEIFPDDEKEFITKALKKGEDVTLTDFETLKVVKRKARKGRNPRTGEELKIKASKAPKFTAGKGLKAAVK
jgi:DNA-binding protein HU-beta